MFKAIMPPRKKNNKQSKKTAEHYAHKLLQIMQIAIIIKVY